MSFWTTLGTGLATGFGKTLGAGAASYGAGRIFQGEGESRGQARKNFHTDMKAQQVWTEKNARLGRDLDVEAQQQMFDFRMQRAEEAGLTNVEAFGSPSAGAGGGTGAATTTLGNSAATSGAQMRQSAMQAKIAADENQKDRMASLAQTAMQTDAQKEVAEISADATTGSAEITARQAAANKAVDKAIADGRLKLDRDTLNANVKLITIQVSKNEQEVKKLINETATSDARFVTAMKQLSMGPANLLVELTMRHHGIKLSDESWTDLPKDQREAILAQILALSSTAYVEGKGATALASDAADATMDEDDSLVNKVIESITNQFMDDQIEATDGPTLGSRMSESYAPGPNMNYR